MELILWITLHKESIFRWKVILIIQTKLSIIKINRKKTAVKAIGLKDKEGTEVYLNELLQ